MPAGSKPGERRGGRQSGTPNQLPDLRAITLKALMKAGGVEYLVRQADENPGPFLGLLGKVMPRELNMELSGELKIRAEVRRDLVEKVIVLMRAEPQNEPDSRVIDAAPAPLPAIAHTPDTMLKAQREAPKLSNSRSQENARAEGAAITSGVMQRATAMHLERPKKSQGYMEEALARIDGVRGSALNAQSGELPGVRDMREDAGEDAAQSPAFPRVGAPNALDA